MSGTISDPKSLDVFANCCTLECSILHPWLYPLLIVCRHNASPSCKSLIQMRANSGPYIVYSFEELHLLFLWTAPLLRLLPINLVSFDLLRSPPLSPAWTFITSASTGNSIKGLAVLNTYSIYPYLLVPGFDSMFIPQTLVRPRCVCVCVYGEGFNLMDPHLLLSLFNRIIYIPF